MREVPYVSYVWYILVSMYVCTNEGMNVHISQLNEENFRYRIILLDTRSNKNGREQGFLGEEQWQWLDSQLVKSPEG